VLPLQYGKPLNMASLEVRIMVIRTLLVVLTPAATAVFANHILTLYGEQMEGGTLKT
jgi:hypothetical protein